MKTMAILLIVPYKPVVVKYSVLKKNVFLSMSVFQHTITVIAGASASFVFAVVCNDVDQKLTIPPIGFWCLGKPPCHGLAFCRGITQRLLSCTKLVFTPLRDALKEARQISIAMLTEKIQISTEDSLISNCFKQNRPTCM